MNSGLSYRGIGSSSHRSYIRSAESGRSSNQKGIRELSPTKYYRTQHSIQRIEKFLDKQAVRDLIIEYDKDDIFINGEDEWYQQLAEDWNENAIINFSKINDGRRVEWGEELRVQFTGNKQTNNKNVERKSEQIKPMPKDEPNKPTKRSKVGGAFTKPRSTLWNLFFMVSNIKVVQTGIKRRKERNKNNNNYNNQNNHRQGQSSGDIFSIYP
ncbi:hypothetical protein RDWZM_004879 [Blomia tropicalis]|uniref:Uncharacterized protein n=1 Tax=Blomia tropicalis TaxID=40697 RepID=A0A9Q0M4X5_BLOTA|nr:hypothetical protein RDWZM_004879 [Blomia tropicalis]